MELKKKNRRISKQINPCVIIKGRSHENVVGEFAAMHDERTSFFLMVNKNWQDKTATPTCALKD